MDSKFPSAYERMMQELKAKGQVGVLDSKASFKMQQEVNQHMETFDIAKQQKAAESEKQAASVVLTA